MPQLRAVHVWGGVVTLPDDVWQRIRAGRAAQGLNPDRIDDPVIRARISAVVHASTPSVVPATVTGGADGFTRATPDPLPVGSSAADAPLSPPTEGASGGSGEPPFDRDAGEAA